MATPASTASSFNIAPVVHAPISYTVSDFFPLPLTGIVFSDADAGGAAEFATFTVDTGFLSAIGGGGVTVNGSGTSTLTLSGTIADLNAFIAGGALGYFGLQSVLHVTIDDLGHSGSGGALTANIDVPIEFDGGPRLAPPTDGDFNGDHLGDLLLSGKQGSHAIWQLRENALLDATAALPDTGPTWHAKATVDFDAVGGYSDILWQNDNGALAIWQMQGATIVNQVNLANPGAATHVMGARDFDGNGGADILLQNDDGALSLWMMDDAMHVGSMVTIAQNPGAPWHAIAGDFNGDGKAGILFTRTSGGSAIWEDFVDNGSGQGGFDVQANLQDNGRTWHVKATGDFDGDHKDDILWQNDSGLAAIWLMDGVQVKSGHNISGSDANGPTWHAVDARDMNGDGRADIVWQNDNGAIALWENFTVGNDGAAVFTTQLNVASTPQSDWHVL